MNFSKRSRYGIRALIDLAQSSESCCMQLSDIADRNSISAKYLEQIFAALRKAGIIKSLKGPQGGYFLAERPEDLKVADIIRALDGSYSLEPEGFQSGQKGEAEALAVQKAIIDPINEQTDRFLNALTLRNLADCAEEYEGAAQNMYYI